MYLLLGNLFHYNQNEHCVHDFCSCNGKRMGANPDECQEYFFFNGDLERKVYMNMPPGYKSEENCCKLKKHYIA